jgi:hypothetical protein
MAYISTEEVAAIRKQLKAEMPEYKFSVKKCHHSSVTVAFMKGPAWEEFQTRDRYTGEYKDATMDDHEQLNHVWATDFYGEKNGAIIKKVEKIIKTAFYMSIHIGQWDKPYVAV